MTHRLPVEQRHQDLGENQDEPRGSHSSGITGWNQPFRGNTADLSWEDPGAEKFFREARTSFAVTLTRARLRFARELPPAGRSCERSSLGHVCLAIELSAPARGLREKIHSSNRPLGWTPCSSVISGLTVVSTSFWGHSGCFKHVDYVCIINSMD